MANYSKLKVTWRNNLNNIYKENTIIGVGQEAVINMSENSISLIYVNFKVDNDFFTDLVEINGNIIQVPFKTDVLKAGTHQLEIVAYLKNGDIVPSPTFSYYVEKSLENTDAIKADTHYPILIELLEKVEEWNERIPYQEEQRIANENERKSNEINRQSNENTRQSNETSRQQYETQRRVEEDERLTDEQVRVNAENIRIANENERLRKEIERQNAEELRQIAYNSSLYGRIDEAEDRLNEVDSQLAHKANLSEITENFVLKGKVKGIRDDGVTLSVLTNSKSPNPETPVCGFKNSAHTSTYTDRDSVSFYADNRSVDATLKIETSIEYFDLGVKIPNEINLKAYEINENMVIDTLHENKYSSLINYIDYDNNIIYVKEGWYYNNKKGVPTNDFGVKVNSITKIWGINSNIILDGNSDCYQGVVCEYGIYNDRIDGVAGGVDVVSLGEYQLQFGYQARKGDDAIHDMKVGYLSRDAKCGFKNKSNNDNGILIQTSDYNGNYDENINFQILNDGTLNKLKLITTVYIDDLQIGDTTGIALLVPPDGNMKYKLPSVNNRYGCQLTILNASDYNTTISSTNDIISSNQKSKNYTLKPFESVTLISDLSNYYVISDTIAYPPNLIKNEKWDIGKNSDRFGKAFFDDYVCLRAYFDNEFPQEEIPKGAMAYYHVTNRPIWYNGTYWHYADGSRI